MYFRKMTGNKCYLSPIDINDAEKYTQWLNDLEVTENLSFYNRVVSVENEKRFLENNLSKDHHYAIVNKSNDELIGICGFINIDYLNQTVEIGIFIGNKSCWNKGYGSEALTLLLDYGFKALNFHNIGLAVYQFNKRAVSSYEKVGFKVTGRKREALKRGKETYDIIYMDILCHEFYEENKIIKEIMK